MQRELAARGVRWSENTLAKLMRREGIHSKTRRRFVVLTSDSRHAHLKARNRLAQAFNEPHLNRTWAAEITYIPTQEGWLYLADVTVLCTRKTLGWASGDSLRTPLVCKAVRMARVQRAPVLHPRDGTVQYACDDNQALLAAYASCRA